MESTPRPRRSRAAAGDPHVAAGPLVARWLGRIAYRDAWAVQRALVALRGEDRIPDQLLLLEHGPVVTLGRHADPGHVLAPPALLAERGIEVVRVERGGEVTYHGPGQLVAYPIVDLDARRLGVRPFVEALEAALAETCAVFGVRAGSRAGHPGCWCDPDSPLPRKIGALGIRVRRGIAFHGIALNVSVDLADFGLIDPCGMPGLASTSLARERGEPAVRPTTESVAAAAAAFAPALARRLGAELRGALPPAADGAAERAALDRLVATAPDPAALDELAATGPGPAARPAATGPGPAASAAPAVPVAVEA